ncbi:MAG: hypothetical protein V4436_00535 [Patescibacteria group bacterium]
MHYRLLFLALLFIPQLAFGAGFAKQSLFLSKSPVIEGESVLIHTVVQNDSTIKFDGSLVISAQKAGGEKAKVGSVAVSIAPQGANTVSVSWKPLAGEYSVVADLTAADGTVVESQTAHFTINEKPKPTTTSNDPFNQSGSEVQSSAEVQAMIAKFSPPLADVSKPIFNTIDSWRAQAGTWLDQGIGWSKKNVGAKSPSEVLGASTQNTSPQSLMGTLSYLAAMFALYFFSILKWLVANTGIFYPVVAIAFLYMLWRLFARFRKPNY